MIITIENGTSPDVAQVLQALANTVFYEDDSPWSPTVEQYKVLQALFGGELRRPSADELAELELDEVDRGGIPTTPCRESKHEGRQHLEKFTSGNAEGWFTEDGELVGVKINGQLIPMDEVRQLIADNPVAFNDILA